MKTLHACFVPLFVALFLLQGCAMFQASPMPKLADAKTPSEAITIAYGELKTLADTVNNLKAAGVVFSQAELNETADTIDKLRMVVDLYALSRVPDLTPSHRLKLKSNFSKDVRIYNMAMEIFMGYENTADGQLRSLMMVNTLAIELIKQMEKRQ